MKGSDERERAEVPAAGVSPAIVEVFAEAAKAAIPAESTEEPEGEAGGREDHAAGDA